jgi:hypothetical protein
VVPAGALCWRVREPRSKTGHMQDRRGGHRWHVVASTTDVARPEKRRLPNNGEKRLVPNKR